MKNKVFSLVAAVLFMSSSLNATSFASIDSNNNQETIVNIEDDGIVCNLIASEVRDILEENTDLSDETLDAVEKAVYAVCDELL